MKSVLFEYPYDRTNPIEHMHEETRPIGTQEQEILKNEVEKE